MEYSYNVNMIEAFLRRNDSDFPVPISEKCDLREYAEKLFQKGTLKTHIADGRIVAMVGGYLNDTVNNLGFISVAATDREYRGQGIARRLVSEFLADARGKGLSGVHVYAVYSNLPAMRLYEELGFKTYKAFYEPRPSDAHLIKYF